MELPSRRENPISTQGKKGAWKLSRPKKFILTLGFRLLQMYTSMMVKAWPRNTRLTKVPNIWRHVKNLTNSNGGADDLKGGQPLKLEVHFHFSCNTRIKMASFDCFKITKTWNSPGWICFEHNSKCKKKRREKLNISQMRLSHDRHFERIQSWEVHQRGTWRQSQRCVL